MSEDIIFIDISSENEEENVEDEPGKCYSWMTRYIASCFKTKERIEVVTENTEDDDGYEAGEESSPSQSEAEEDTFRIEINPVDTDFDGYDGDVDGQETEGEPCGRRNEEDEACKCFSWVTRYIASCFKPKEQIEENTEDDDGGKEETFNPLDNDNDGYDGDSEGEAKKPAAKKAKSPRPPRSPLPRRLPSPRRPPRRLPLRWPPRSPLPRSPPRRLLPRSPPRRLPPRRSKFLPTPLSPKMNSLF